MTTVMGYEVAVDVVDRNPGKPAWRVQVSAHHPEMKSFFATFELRGRKLAKYGQKDIPLVILAEMRRQAAAILREGRGLARRGNRDDRRSRARLRQEEASRERARDGQLDMFDVK